MATLTYEYNSSIHDESAIGEQLFERSQARGCTAYRTVDVGLRARVTVELRPGEDPIMLFTDVYPDPNAPINYTFPSREENIGYWVTATNPDTVPEVVITPQTCIDSVTAVLPGYGIYLEPSYVTHPADRTHLGTTITATESQAAMWELYQRGNISQKDLLQAFHLPEVETGVPKEPVRTRFELLVSIDYW